MDQNLVIRRRVIQPADLTLIRQLIEAEGPRGRSHLSNRLCELWDWRQANGRYRQIACRELLRRLEARGLIQLPAPRQAARRAGYRNRTHLPAFAHAGPLSGSLAQCRSQLRLELVRDPAQRRVFAGLIGAYHYLGYQQATGAQLQYLVWLAERPIGALSFGPAAWQLAPRDHYIGWSAAARQARLDWVVNNDRFLIVAGVHIPQLASAVLSATVRRLRTDWPAVHGREVVLAETFLEAERFAGQAYAAANWVCVGPTQGRGRQDRTWAQALPIKTVWVYGLRADFRAVLCQEP